MAKPIQKIELKQPTPQQIEDAQIANLLHELAHNEEALKKVLSIVQQLEKMGGLDAVDSLLKARTEVTHVVVDQVQKQPAQNLILLVQALAGIGASIDGERTKAFLSDIKQQQQEAPAFKKNYLLLRVFKLIKDPDTWRAVTFLLVILKSLGSVLKKPR